MRDKLPPYVKVVKSRGREYWYLERFRGTDRAEPRQRLPDTGPRDPEWWAEYARLCGVPSKTINTNAVHVALDAWKASPEWKALSPKTAYEWRRYCTRITAAWGDLDIRGIEPRHVLKLRDLYADTPAAANNMLRCLSSFMSWSVPRGYRASNPCREVRPLKGGDGYAPWPWEMIELARERLRVDLWWFVALALYTGQRRGDVLAMKWSAIRDGRITVTQAKTNKVLWIPIHRELKPILDVIPRRAETVLTSWQRQPWTGSGFSATWRKSVPQEIADAGLVLHGLRKSAVCFLLEAGCTDAEVSAITGQSREMVAHYSRQVNQGKLAAAAVLKWETLGNRSVD
jgi:hypothetical protein